MIYNIADFVDKIAFVLCCWSCAKSAGEKLSSLLHAGAVQVDTSNSFLGQGKSVTRLTRGSLSVDVSAELNQELEDMANTVLNHEIIECKEYQEMNRATFDQVLMDISRSVARIV